MCFTDTAKNWISQINPLLLSELSPFRFFNTVNIFGLDSTILFYHILHVNIKLFHTAGLFPLPFHCFSFLFLFCILLVNREDYSFILKDLFTAYTPLWGCYGCFAALNC